MCIMYMEGELKKFECRFVYYIYVEKPKEDSKYRTQLKCFPRGSRFGKRVARKENFVTRVNFKLRPTSI